MPGFAIEAPEGAPTAAKQEMLKKISEALHEAYRIPDIRGFVREYPAESFSQDGRIGAEPMRPVCALDAPELASLDVKQELANKICAAIADAYQDIANTAQTVVLIRQYADANQGINQVFGARPARAPRA